MAVSPSPPSAVDVQRNGVVLAPGSANDGVHVDNVGKRAGTHRYRVCEAGSSTCSPEVTVTVR